MSIFHYTALDASSAYSRGRVDARNQKKAMAALEGQGLLVINLRKEQSDRWSKINTVWSRVSRLDRIFFTKHLLTMIESGISLDQAIKITAEQTTNRHLREVLLDLHSRVQKGQTFYSALAQHPKYFSNFYVSLVKVGESSGKLDQVLEYLNEQQERDYELVSKARSAMVYPSIILTALFLIVIFMMIFIVPRVTGVLVEYNVQLPLATRALIAMSNFVIHIGPYLLPVIIVVIALLRRWIRTPKGKWKWDTFLLHIPRARTILKEFNIARITRSLSSMLKSGVAIDQALLLAADVAGNSHYQRSIRAGIKFVQKGVGIGEVLKGYPDLYPPLTTRMVEVGERTGKLDHMFTRLASFYEKSVLTTLTNMASIIEPLLLIAIGLSVGFLAIAVLTPIWKFAETI